MLYPIAIPSASLLFFFRLRAVFLGNKLVTSTFAILWLCELATSLMYPLSFPLGYVTSNNVDESMPSACLPHFDQDAGKVLLLPITMTFLFDTLVLIAISWRLTKNTHTEQGFRNGVRTFFGGKYLPAFSQALLQDNQLYYLCVVPVILGQASVKELTAIVKGDRTADITHDRPILFPLKD
ncbi:hypothetical protein BJ165DRAFT_1527878 [Panaeolus papilionaceus]|nr:hypothetical protein BJ165DRAFT_1527878 [Panaeolus papilionaceus]